MPFLPGDSVALSTGIQMPVIANGSGETLPPLTEDTIAKVKGYTLTALKVGYRKIDTAYFYETEKSVGSAIKESGLNRADVFVTTKLTPTHYHRVQECFNESLTDLGLDYVDLYLMHWPLSATIDTEGNIKPTTVPTINDVWFEMENIFEQRKARAIGVSNFSVKTLEVLLKTAKVVPAVNQVETHPYLAQNELKEYCKNKGIVVEAYSPSGTNKVRSDPLIVQIAEKHKATPNQVILAWHLARDTALVPKSSDEQRQKENLNLPVLSQEEVEQIDALDRGERIANKPDEHGLVFGMTMEDLGW